MPIQRTRKAVAPASDESTVLVPLTTMTTPAPIKLSSTGIVVEPGWTYVLNSDGHVVRRGADGFYQFVRFGQVVRRAGWEYFLDVDGDIVGVPRTAQAAQSVDVVRARGAAVMARQAAVEARTAKKKAALAKMTRAKKTPAKKTPAKKKPAKKKPAKKKPAKKSATTATKRQQAQHQRQ